MRIRARFGGRTAKRSGWTPPRTSRSRLTFDQIAAVADGDERWRREFEPTEGTTNKEIVDVTSGRLFLLVERDRTESGRRKFRLDAIDVATGDRDWTLGSIEHSNPENRPRVAVRGEIAYVGTDRLRALDATTGDERRSASLDDGPSGSASVVEEGVPDDHVVFVHSGIGSPGSLRAASGRLRHLPRRRSPSISSANRCS